MTAPRCERCAGPIDGPAHRLLRVVRCTTCARICRRCDERPVDHPYLVCRPCWPTCEHCGGVLPTKGRRTARVRCDACVDLCRQCDSPLSREDDPQRQRRLCPACAGSCPRCGGQSVGYGANGLPRVCSACNHGRLREADRAAKQALGGCCARCGIASPVVWDHVNDDARTVPGRKRPSVRVSEKAEIRRIALIGRSDRLQLLCPNCNHLKHHDRAEYERPPTYGPLAL